ncbi:MAG TPA: DNA repair protein RadC [Candidatus Kapabacteria bacterium]|nr:DNA repair protein RadC [Candidatus Kapabacteria bacterium]
MTPHAHTEERELRAALERLFSLQTFGIKLGLEPITALLDEFGNPHRRFPTVHIAGTNGKGSASAMMASVLQAAGLRVGLYTSPHLTQFNERIRVNGEAIGNDRLALYTREMMPAIERNNCTFFEGTTAMGFRFFAEENVDVAIIETGLGGRLDATNVVTPLVSVITSIGYDHMKHLGDTLEEIAAEKAGIIKPAVPVVVGPVARRLRAIFLEKGAAGNSPVRFVEDSTNAIRRGIDEGGTTASFIVGGREIPDLRIDFVGYFQIENAQTALAALDVLQRHFPLEIDAVRRGFGTIRDSTGLRGRFEIARHNPRIVLDVAHNPDGMRVLIESLAAILPPDERKVLFVYGAVEDKDVAEVMAILAPNAKRVYAVCADSPRSQEAEEIAHHARNAGIDTIVAGSVARGIGDALHHAGPEDTIVICGSFFVVADAIEALRWIDRSDRTIGDAVPDNSDGYGTEDAPSPNVAEHMIGGDVPAGVGERTRRYHVRYQQPDPVEATPINSIPDIPGQLEDYGTAPDDASDPESTSKRSIKEWNENDQPRERLMRLGPRALSDAELLAILLRTGRVGEDVLQVSRNILNRFENLAKLSARDVKELQQVAGVGPTKAVTLAAALEIGRRLQSIPFSSRPVINSPHDAARIYVPLLRGIQKEQFHVLVLNSAGQVIRMELISEGTLNGAVVHPREVFRTAIVEHAAGIIGLHNHPSGNPQPSQEDLEITRQLKAAGTIIGIPLRDHIIIAGDAYVSLADAKLM